VGLINGNIVNKGFFSQFTGAKYYWLFIGILAVTILLFMLIAKRLPEKSYVGLDEEAIAKAEQ
jgi:POT family proton-dependent oligopeptide transporter